jgi:hypothetical protein
MQFTSLFFPYLCIDSVMYMNVEIFRSHRAKKQTNLGLLGTLNRIQMLIFFLLFSLSLSTAVNFSLFVCWIKANKRNLSLIPSQGFCPHQGCQIFLGPNIPKRKKYTKWPETIPKGHKKMYQMAVKYYKWS